MASSPPLPPHIPFYSPPLWSSLSLPPSPPPLPPPPFSAICHLPSSAMVIAAAEAPFHVLAVDDSLLDRKLIEKLLKTSSYQVTVVESGTKALEFLGLHDERRSPSSSSSESQDVEVSLIITDYCMPGMTGYDLLRRVKESASLKDIPVVIMSSENVPSRISRCLEDGAEEFFLKPVRLADLKKLRPHLSKRKSKEQQLDQQPNPQPQQQQLQQQQQQQLQQQQQQLQQPQQQPQQQQLQQQQLQQLQQQQLQANNKRKAIDESLSQNNTRQRHNGLTVL